MSNYREWKDEFGEIFVEIFNECDILNIQREYINKGYIIIAISRNVFTNRTFMKIENFLRLEESMEDLE